MPHPTDRDQTEKDVTELASPDAVTAFLAKLGYDTSDRTALSPEAVGLSGESAGAIKRIELLSEDPEKFLRVVFAHSSSPVGPPRGIETPVAPAVRRAAVRKRPAGHRLA